MSSKFRLDKTLRTLLFRETISTSCLVIPRTLLQVTACTAAWRKTLILPSWAPTLFGHKVRHRRQSTKVLRRVKTTLIQPRLRIPMARGHSLLDRLEIASRLELSSMVKTSLASASTVRLSFRMPMDSNRQPSSMLPLCGILSWDLPIHGMVSGIPMWPAAQALNKSMFRNRAWSMECRVLPVATSCRSDRSMQAAPILMDSTRHRICRVMIVHSGFRHRIQRHTPTRSYPPKLRMEMHRLIREPARLLLRFSRRVTRVNSFPFNPTREARMSDS